MNAKVVTLKSKKSGKDFTALQVNIGDYSGLLFPTKIELHYVSDYLQNRAHNDFKDELTEDAEEDIFKD